MKAKFLFSALLISASFVACTNDLTETINAEKPTQEVVGADLVAKGMSINLTSGANTRAVNGKWEAGDKFGLAWYNVASNIFDKQEKSIWEKGTKSAADNNIYANNLFTNVNDQFITTANIYQGAYFVYFPFKQEYKVAPKVFEVNPDQTENFDKERYNKALHISAQDFISQGDAVFNEETNGLTKEFVLVPAVNVLKVLVNGDEKIASNDFMKGLTIKQVKVTSNNNAFAVKTAEVDPAQIPHVVRYTTGANKGQINEEKTIEAMDKFLGEAYGTLPYEKTLTTNVKIENFNLDSERAVRMFTLPTKKDANVTSSSMTITVGREGYVLGTFAVNTKNNEETLTKLNEFLGETEGKTLTKILRKNGDWSLLNLPVVADVTAFNPNTSNIASEEQWNDVIDMIDALDELGVAKKEYTLTLKNDLEFKNGIKAPKNVKVTVEYTGKKIVVTGDTEWPANVKGAMGTKTSNIGIYFPVEVNGANLTVNNDINEYLDLKAVNSNAVITLNKDAKIHLAQNLGRVVINEYGAKVVLGGGLTDETSGVIAFKYIKDTPNYKINNLITPSTTAQHAHALVNTIIVENTTVDLNKTESIEGSEDPYTGVVAGEDITINSNINNVNFELVGNGIVRDGKIANVTAKGNGNQMIDITNNDNTNITVEVGADLTVNTESKTKEFAYNSLKNSGIFTAGNGVTVKFKAITNIGTPATIHGDVK